MFEAGNGISSKGAMFISLSLKKNKSLHTLLLCKHHLDYINIGHNKIGPLGAKELAVGLKSNRSLKKLNLGFANIYIEIAGNKIETEGSIKLVMPLQGPHPLSSLDICRY